MKACNFIKTRCFTQMLSCEYKKLLRTPFYRTPLVAASRRTLSCFVGVVNVKYKDIHSTLIYYFAQLCLTICLSLKNLLCNPFFCNAINIQKQPTELSCKKGCSSSFSKFTGKHPCQSLFFNKSVQAKGLQLY